MSPAPAPSAAQSPDALFTTLEAAAYMKLSRATLERMRLTGSGPMFLKLGPGKRARVVYRLGDIQAWLDGLRFASTSQYAQRRAGS